MARFHNYYVYICSNFNKSVLYIGVTNNLEVRMAQHKFDSENHTNTFCGKYKCFYLLYAEYYRSISAAINREKQLKRWSRTKKFDLIRTENPNLDFIEI